MNRFFVAPMVLLLSTGLFAQNLTYMRMADVAGSNKIALVDMDDFVKVIKDNKVRNVFFSKDQFAVQVGAFLYTIPSSGFATIADYKEGKRGFSNGDAFYIARKNGLSTSAEVEYFRKERFLSGDDYRKALKAGFVNNSIEPKPKGVVGLMRRADLQKNIYFADALFALTLFKEGERAEREGLLKNADIEYLVKLGEVRPFGDDLYYLNIRADKRTRSVVESINRLLNGRGGEIGDALTYYMAMLSLYRTAEEYQAAVKAQAAEIKGTRELYLAAGFKSLADVERAIASGFASGAEFALATEYGLKDSAEFRAAEEKIDAYESLRKTYRLRSRIDAFVVDQLLALPKGVPVSLERFADQYNSAVAADKLLAKGSYKINEEFLVGLFDMTPGLAGRFLYDPEGKTVQRR